MTVEEARGRALRHIADVRLGFAHHADSGAVIDALIATVRAQPPSEAEVDAAAQIIRTYVHTMLGWTILPWGEAPRENEHWREVTRGAFDAALRAAREAGAQGVGS